MNDLKDLGWTSYLDRDEEILWQGRPDQAFKVQIDGVLQLGMSIFFVAFSVFWMFGASQAGGMFWMFGLLFFFVGLGQLFRSIFGPTVRRRSSWYTLTDRRAFIATEYPFVGRKLKSYPITAQTVLDFRADDLSSIYFAEETKRGQDGTYTIPIGFERLRQGDAVYRLMRDVQQKEVAK